MNKPMEVSERLMRANHYPGTSTPAMGPGSVGRKMPRQKTKRSPKGGRPSSMSPPNYNYAKDAYEG